MDIGSWRGDRADASCWCAPTGKPFCKHHLAVCEKQPRLTFSARDNYALACALRQAASGVPTILLKARENAAKAWACTINCGRLIKFARRLVKRQWRVHATMLWLTVRGVGQCRHKLSNCPYSGLWSAT